MTLAEIEDITEPIDIKVGEYIPRGYWISAQQNGYNYGWIVGGGYLQWEDSTGVPAFYVRKPKQ